MSFRLVSSWMEAAAFMVTAGIAHEQDTDGGRVQRAIPQAANLCEEYLVTALVAVHGRGSEAEAGSEVGRSAQAVALQAGPARAPRSGPSSAGRGRTGR